jgi:hypothetical protein
MWLQKFKKKDSMYVPYDRELVALSLLALLFLLLSPSYLIAQKVIVPGDDIVQVIQDSPAEKLFQIEPGSIKLISHLMSIVQLLLSAVHLYYFIPTDVLLMAIILL